MSTTEIALNHQLAGLLEQISILEAENRSLRERLSACVAAMESLQKSELRRHNTVTILFITITQKNGFEIEQARRHSDKMEEVKIRFQQIALSHGLVNHSSIGDSFIFAGGIPRKSFAAPLQVVMAAAEMYLYIKEMNTEAQWGFTFAIHTGSVSAKLQNKAKNTYELKGEALNIASRIAGTASEGGIYVSAPTYELVREMYKCRLHSVLPAKYESKLAVYVLEYIKSPFGKADGSLEPGEGFRTRLLGVQFTDLQEMILEKLEKELPKHLFYHNVKHTVDVVTQAELLGYAEGLDDYQVLLLKTAALFHDSGHTVSYKDHEARGCEIAREVLPLWKYSAEEIAEVCRIIMATKLPPSPKDLMEEIICDSDLDYLGRADFVPVSNTLYEELRATNPALTLNDWNKQQVKFLSMHQYFTKTGRQLREVQKQDQIERIKTLITEDNEDIAQLA